MKTDFDFDEIGKRTPYRTPDGFFEDAQRQVMERVGIHRHRHRLSRVKLVALTALATAAIVSGLMWMPTALQGTSGQDEVATRMLADEGTQGTDASDTWIQSLSDEQLSELLSLSDNDLFLN
jgi:hypothetical protein